MSLKFDRNGRQSSGHGLSPDALLARYRRDYEPTRRWLFPCLGRKFFGRRRRFPRQHWCIPRGGTEAWHRLRRRKILVSGPTTAAAQSGMMMAGLVMA